MFNEKEDSYKAQHESLSVDTINLSDNNYINNISLLLDNINDIYINIESKKNTKNLNKNTQYVNKCIDLQNTLFNIQNNLKDFNNNINILLNNINELKNDFCEHHFIKEFPTGMRDNNDYSFRCSKCNYKY